MYHGMPLSDDLRAMSERGGMTSEETPKVRSICSPHLPVTHTAVTHTDSSWALVGVWRLAAHQDRALLCRTSHLARHAIGWRFVERFGTSTECTIATRAARNGLRKRRRGSI